MYQHILIPTDGSKLAHRAVTHGLSLAKAVGAKVTALVVDRHSMLPCPDCREPMTLIKTTASPLRTSPALLRVRRVPRMRLSFGAPSKKARHRRSGRF